MAAEKVKAMFPKITEEHTKIDPFTPVEMGLVAVGVVAPPILKDMYAPRMFDSVYSMLYGSPTGVKKNASAEVIRNVENAEKIANVSWYIIAIVAGVAIWYVGNRTGKDAAKYIAMPVILANVAYMLLELRR